MAPTVRSFSAGFEPLGLIARFPECYPGLLDSGAAAVGNRYDILPISSGETLVLRADGTLRGPHATGAAGFLDALERWWSALRASPCAGADAGEPGGNSRSGPIAADDALDLPFSGGWLVYLGYELAREIEPHLKLPSGPDGIVGLAIRTPAAWIHDHAARHSWLMAEPGFEGLLDRFEAHVLARGEPSASALAMPHLVEEAPGIFLQSVQRALEYIAAGDVYQANLSRQWLGESRHIDPMGIYARLRRSNPGPFSALLRIGEFAIMSSSPERLVCIRGDRVSTRPIAGTRPRGATAGEDAALVRSLIDDDKERAEHVMLIDLERNDLGRVCEGGTIAVDEYMTVESYAHVHHIVSSVSGRLRAGVSPLRVIRALFPGGTITGCPKVRCMEIIAELERVGRGAYTGSLGYLNRDGSCDFNILIRTIVAEGGRVRFRAGAGIVADSNAVRELEETRAKARGMLQALRAT